MPLWAAYTAGLQSVFHWDCSPPLGPKGSQGKQRSEAVGTPQQVHCGWCQGQGGHGMTPSVYSPLSPHQENPLAQGLGLNPWEKPQEGSSCPWQCGACYDWRPRAQSRPPGCPGGLILKLPDDQCLVGGGVGCWELVSGSVYVYEARVGGGGDEGCSFLKTTWMSSWAVESSGHAFIRVPNTQHQDVTSLIKTLATFIQEGAFLAVGGNPGNECQVFHLLAGLPLVTRQPLN